MENRRAFQSSPLTVKEAVVFEAAPAEECVEGVQRLFPLHRLGVGAVDVGCALRGAFHMGYALMQLHNYKKALTYLLPLKTQHNSPYTLQASYYAGYCTTI